MKMAGGSNSDAPPHPVDGLLSLLLDLKKCVVVHALHHQYHLSIKKKKETSLAGFHLLLPCTEANAMGVLPPAGSSSVEPSTKHISIEVLADT